MRVGIVGTGAVAWKHAEAYKNIGYQLRACTNATPERGRKFADATGAELLETVEQLCSHSEIDFVDRNEDLQQLLRRLQEPVKGTQYFLPLGSTEAASA